MTLLEALKQLLGSKADDEVSLTDDPEKKDPKDEKDDPEDKKDDKKDDPEDPKDDKKDPKDDKEDPKDEKDDPEVEKEVDNNMAMFEDGWFNSDTGEIDESKITNTEALGAIKMIKDKLNKDNEARLISDSLNDELKNYSLNVSEDTLRKVLDMSKVKIGEDNKVTGVKEALEALKTAEPGFFKDKEKESNPLNEGFNPVEKHGTDNVNSFSQAFKLMEEIG